MSAPGEQVWNFPAIESSENVLMNHSNQIQQGNEEVKSQLTAARSAWSGTASEHFAALLTQFNNVADQFQASLVQLVKAVGEARMNQIHTEGQNAAMFQ